MSIFFNKTCLNKYFLSKSTQITINRQSLFIKFAYIHAMHTQDSILIWTLKQRIRTKLNPIQVNQIPGDGIIRSTMEVTLWCSIWPATNRICWGHLVHLQTANCFSLKLFVEVGFHDCDWIEKNRLHVAVFLRIDFAENCNTMQEIFLYI